MRRRKEVDALLPQTLACGESTFFPEREPSAGDRLRLQGAHGIDDEYRIKNLIKAIKESVCEPGGGPSFKTS